MLLKEKEEGRERVGEGGKENSEEARITGACLFNEDGGGNRAAIS